MKILALFLFTIGSLICSAQEAKSDHLEKQILKRSNELWQWMSDKNVDSLNQLFHDHSSFVHMGGSWGKSQELNIIKSGGIWYKKANIISTKVNILENTAVVLNDLTLIAVVGGNEVTNPFLVTEVFVQKDGRWQLGVLSFTRKMTP